MNVIKTMAVLFYIRKDKPNKQNQLPVYMRIIIESSKVEISLKRFIDENLWNAKIGRAKGKSDEAASLNNQIEQFQLKAFDAYGELIKNNIPLVAINIKDAILGLKTRRNTIISVADYHNEQMEKMLGISTTYGNYKNFKTTVKYLNEFIPDVYRVRDIALSDLKYKFIVDFVSWLQTVKSCRNNGAMKHVQRVKKLVHIALMNEWIASDPIANYTIKFHYKQREHLTLDEVNRIIQLSGLSKKLKKVRDIFIFACFTGLAYIDVKLLRKEHIITGIDGKQWIRTKRQKTNTNLDIPLLSFAFTVIEEYLNASSEFEFIFPVMSSQKMNDYLKEIAALADIRKHLTFHMARHTFATAITLSNGVPLETVSRLLGHTSVRTTQIYSKVLTEKIKHDMDNLQKKLLHD